MNKLKVLIYGKTRNGGSVSNLIRMVNYNHPEVEFCIYQEGMRGDVLLGVDRTMSEVKMKIRKVNCMASVPSFLKYKHNRKIGSLNHTFFISEYCRNLFSERGEYKDSSILLPVGPLPADPNFDPIVKTRSIEGPINFLAMAKWYKRPYKRLERIKHLYRKYLRKEYPDSILNVIGTKQTDVEDGIHYYRKSFHNEDMADLVKKCHIHIIPTAFDTGPKTLTESLHYRIPFVCSKNCSGSEYMEFLGKCGIEVHTDTYIDSMEKYRKNKPLNPGSEMVKSRIPYDEYTDAIKEIVNNFEEYTSWKWNDKLNYKKQSDNLYNILKGE